MGMFDNVYNAFMKNLHSDPSKDIGSYDKNDKTPAKSDADVGFAAFVKEYVGKTLVRRRITLRFFGDKPRYGYVKDNFIRDDIRRITNIKKGLLGGYSFTLKALNAKNKSEAVTTMKVKSFDELKRIFEGFKTQQIRVEDYDDEVWIEIVSNRKNYDFGAWENLEHMTHNPSEFVLAAPGVLSDWNKIEKVIIKTIATKCGKSEEEIKSRIDNDDDILPKEWKFRDHNVELTNYAMG